MGKKYAETTAISRRAFLGAAALAGTGIAFTIGKPDSLAQNIESVPSEDIYYTKNPVYRWGTSAHNCGGRCSIKAQVVNGRIARFLTDDSDKAFDGSPINGDNRNSTQSRACSRCRAYRERLYHPGRLKYPLKQTKERGDVTGFKRISWSQAFKEMSERLKAVQKEYGPESMHAIYACGNIASQFQGASYTGVFGNNDFGSISAALSLLGGSTQYTSDYSFHQASYMGGYGPAFSGMINSTVPTSNDIAGCGKYVMMWGSNIPTTHNAFAYPWVKGIEDMKKRDPESKVVFIGPELSEVGITLADEWIQIKPYTDIAFINAMIYEMIVNTVDKNGKLLKNPWLDIDYLDTMVYGFFDSPQYWLAADGSISLEAKEGYTKIEEVPAGKSLSAYVMGNDNRLTKLAYGTGNYIASKFTEKYPKLSRNKTTCAYNASKSTKYDYKKDFSTPKTPEWAEKITGIPAQKIREIARLYVEAAKKGEPVYNEWSGGQLKQAEGCVTLYSLQTLLIVTKNWGITGTGIANKKIGRSKKNDPNEITAAMVTPKTWSALPKMPKHPIPGVTQWSSAVKFAFGDALKANGYKHNIPDLNMQLKNGEAYFNDGGVKSLVTRHIGAGAPDASTYTVTGKDGISRTYYDYEGRNENKVKFAGFRFLLNTGGNIPVNQHANPIDSTDMFKHLPTYGYEDAKYNVKDMKDAFYLVTFDNFMSPSARYSDYVLPAKTTWEQEDFVGLEASGTLYIDSVIEAPGESLSTWDFAREWIKVYAGADSAAKFTGDTPNTTFKQVVQKTYETQVKTNPESPFYNKTWNEFLDKSFSPAKPDTNTTKAVTKIKVREELDNYLAGDKKAPFYAGIESADYQTIYGFGKDEFAEVETCPAQSKRFHVYSGSLVWRYENLFSKWHGYLPLEKQGQHNVDSEGDPVVYPIAMYFNYQDYYREAYGLKDNKELNGRFLLTTTHDRFRAHSSQAENPYLRELTHRTIGGGLYSGNDNGAYAISSNPDGDFNQFPPLNILIGKNGLPTDATRASYTEIWVNPDDFSDMNDGTLVKVENEIGTVYCTLRKTYRCVSGFVGLHQGCWYDPREIDGKIVDVGGNCNTLMASRPSRIDHGNAQQSAMVKISKVEL